MKSNLRAMDAEKVAIIDLGTNTFHLLIAEVNDRDDFLIREKFREVVKLGEGGFSAGLISDMAYKRGLVALKSFRRIMDSRGTNKVLGFATSAIRSASNGKEFIAHAMKEAGIPIRVINGNEEAALIFEGVKSGIQLPYHEQSLVMDIGGGSVEFIVGFENSPILIRSLDLGAARILEKFPVSELPDKNEIAEIRKHIYAEISGLLNELKEFDLSILVGSSGAFETLSAIIAHQKGDLLSAQNLNSYTFTRAEFNKALKHILESSRTERLKIPGMEPMRVDMMVPSAILVDIILTELKMQKCMVSAAALKEGILSRYIREKQEKIKNLMGPQEQQLRAKGVRALGKKFHFDQDHGVLVGELAVSIFDQLQLLHNFGGWEREILMYSAMLHDIGYYLNRSGHHKHGQYLVQNSGLPGFSNDELLVMANIVRYHRKRLPSRDDFHFKLLRQEDRLRVRALSGILRIADNLDRGHRQLVEGLMVQFDENKLEIKVMSEKKTDIEINAANLEKELMEQVFERKVILIQA